MATKKKQPEKVEENSAEDLRLKLKQSELMAHALQTMIEIAEKEFNIDIRKNGDAKQPE